MSNSWGIRIINETTFEAAPLEEKRYRELTVPVEPKGIMYLVRVHGETGDTEGARPTHWDVDIFSDPAEAEALAIAIDENYDLINVLVEMERYGGFHYKREAPKDEDLTIPEYRLHDVPEVRRASIQEKFIEYAKGGFEPSFIENLRKVTYRQNGVELEASTYPWMGYFERLNYVEVLPLRRTSGNDNLLRRRL